MRVDITGRHVEITAELRRLIDQRLAKLGRILNDRGISVSVILTKEKYRHATELVVHARGDHMLRAEGRGTSWALSVRHAAEKAEQQAQKLKSKFTERKRQASAARVVDSPAADTAPARRKIRTSRYPVKPMSIAEAADRVDAGSDTFVVFRNVANDALSIVYRRQDGNLGLIEPD